MKVLKEDNDNKYARAILEVEELMRKNEISFDFIGNRILINIHDREFSLDGSTFPRLFDEERLYLPD